MKKHFKLVLLVVLFACYCIPSWAQVPSTEGQDFWVTFMQWNQYISKDEDKKSRELKLTISAVNECDVHIENTTTGFKRDIHVPANSSVEEVISRGYGNENNENSCYIKENETPDLYRALHVTSTEIISLFAGNYVNKSFDAANVLPTPALLDDYLIQTYPPSDHEDKPQGSHFAIIAVEDGETIVDYNLTTKTEGGKTGAQSVKLKKGQVWYVWTGKNKDDAGDLSGTTVKARNGKKIAVFQGCPHTNIPNKVRDRDHIYSQAMPTAYWGTEFGITASRKHRRDIIAVMALNDGTEVYRNAPDGGKILIHTFDFNKDKKKYWTFEIGEELAYCADGDRSDYSGKLPPPLIVDSSCYISTSCPAGVHLFMVSNRYDNVVEKVDDDTLVSDPAMLWISPIEQVIKEINFATYKTQQAKFHFMNIVTDSANVKTMTWNGQSIKEHFHSLMGNPEYAFARIEINEGNHNLKGETGFLAHVYGYGERESYAYSCGSSTVQRSITFNGTPLMIDSVAPGKFCVNEPIEMKLRIGNNNYQSVVWDFGDGISENGGSSITHTYNAPGWYDLTVSAEYINSCTNKKYNEDYSLTFRVVRPDTVIDSVRHECISREEYKAYPAESEAKIQNGEIKEEPQVHCYDDIHRYFVVYGKETEETKDTIVDQDSAVGYNGKTYYESTDVEDTLTNDYNCPHYVRYHVKVKTCLAMTMASSSENCPGKNIIVDYTKTKGDIKNPVRFVVTGLVDTTFNMSNENTQPGKTAQLYLPTTSIKKPGYYRGTLTIQDANDCDAKTFPIDFAVNYPDYIFDFKFSNVLAVRKDLGYNFTHYQWYINDMPVGGDVSVLYLGENVALREYEDEVYVVLTDQSGMVLKSCPQTIEYKEGQYNPTKAPARKVMQNQRIYILRDEQIYDMFGQKVK